MDNYTLQNGNFVTGIGEHTYQEVIEDFQNTKFIGIITFNISKYSNGLLIDALKKACNGGVHATVITNIPKRFKRYYGDNYAKYDDNVPEQIESLEELYDSYKNDFNEMQRNISDLFEEISQLAHYNYDDEVSRIVNEDYGLESFDENLDYYMQLAMNESNSELEALIESTEPTIRNILESLDAMKDYYERMDSALYSILEINDKIDNT